VWVVFFTYVRRISSQAEAHRKSGAGILLFFREVEGLLNKDAVYG
jgi:hypothetical protein